MSVGIKFHAKDIDCLVSRIENGVSWLEVFARDELPDMPSKIRPLCLIPNTDPKNEFETHWLVLDAPLADSIELLDLFGLFSRIYSINYLDPYLSYSFQSSITSVCNHQCIVYIYLRI